MNIGVTEMFQTISSTVGDHANVCERRDQEWEKQVIGCSLHLALRHFNFDTHPQFSCSSTINFPSLSITLPTTTTFVRCTPITIGHHKSHNTQFFCHNTKTVDKQKPCHTVFFCLSTVFLHTHFSSMQTQIYSDLVQWRGHVLSVFLKI